ncbi:MAG: M48 family metallopeptidase [Deltaproteobacteria bacterium]|nr:M48 family metallopeptidase [Deltaproteobacteria bacterium]
MSQLYGKIKMYAGAALMLALFACATVPVTGRQTLNIISDSELMTMSFQQYREVINKSKLSQDPARVQMIRRVGQRVAGATEDFLRQQGMPQEISKYKWEFNLIDDDKTINAWCMPGGKVAFYTGIIPVAQNDAGIAVVMGHEIAHAIAKHGNERMSQSLLAQLGAAGLSAALAKSPAGTKDVFMNVYGVGANVGFLLPFGRVQELEADRIGLILMAKAGYDPRQAIPFWQRMSRSSSGGRPPALLSTHPVPETRIQDIQAALPEALRYYKAK